MKKAAVTEEDVCILLQRYSAATVLSLLREVAQFSGVKIDWKDLVTKTKTGIKTAREYQMLWRHLAYRQPLIENVGPEDQPLDDDSDLEFELEACPPVSNEDAMEAFNCVKVLASGSANEASMLNSSTIEGGVLNLNSSNAASENLQVQKQLQTAGTCGEGFDANGSTINRKRRKPWSEEEDQELITAVQKFGEGSWAAILKGDFKGNRSATQLAQRWSTIRKKQGTLNIGGAKAAGPQLTEAQLATRHALDVALSTGCGTVGNGTASTSAARSSASKKDLPVAKATLPLSQPQSSPVACTTSSVKPAPVAPLQKLPQKKPAQPSVNADSIQAAAVAAGARIASPSDAASLLKAVQSKKAVHIRGGGSLIQTSAAGSLSPLPPNVHFIRTGLAPTTTSTAAGMGSFSAGQPAKVSTIRPPASLAAASQLPKARSTSSVQQMESRISTAVNVQGSDTKQMTRDQEDSAALPQCLPEALPDKCRATSQGADVGPSKQTADGGNLQGAMIRDVVNKCKDDACKLVDEEKSSAVETCTPKVSGTDEVLPTAIVDGSAEQMEVSNEELA